MKNLPNIFTLLNLFFGCLAIVFALQTESVIINVNEDFNTSYSIPEKLTWAALCIGIAALIDFMDGFVARLLKSTSELGKQLDSLSDVVSFGVAPGVILYQLLRFSFSKEENGLEIPIFFLLPAFLLTCSAAFRLGKFNIDSSQQYNFRGVPVPAVGLLIASFPLIVYYDSSSFALFFINKWVIYFAILLLSYLMISHLPIMSLKFKDYTLKNNIPKILLLIIGVISAFLLHWVAVPIVFICYILISLIFKNTIA